MSRIAVPQAYDAILRSSLAYAISLSQPPEGSVPQAVWTYEKALALVRSAKAPTVDYHDTLTSEICQMITRAWPEFCRGEVTGRDLFRLQPDLWEEWMTSFPMGGYGQQLAAWLNNRSFPSMLELGAGVGNTSRFIQGCSDYVRSDRSKIVLNGKGKLPGTPRIFDFDQDHVPMNWHGRFDVVFSTNALHCSRDPVMALRTIGKALKPRGTIALAEGSPKVDGAEWAMTWMFGIMPIWHRCGGFKTRDRWLAILDQAGYSEPGFEIYKVGDYDLGGIVYATKRD